MGNWLTNLFKPGAIRYERDTSGLHWNYIGDGNAQWGDTQRLQLAKENPIAAILIDFIAEKLGQVEWFIEKGDELSNDDPLIKLLNKPNYYQSKQDYLKQWYWYLVSHGFVYVLPKGSIGFKTIDTITALYNLKGDCVEYKDDFNTLFVSTVQEIKQLEETRFKYTHGNHKHSFTVGEIIPFYDLGNGLDNDFLLKSPSRLDAIKKPLINIGKAYDAENIAIQSNGKELFSSNKKGDYDAAIGIKSDERNDILAKTNQNYGMGAGRSRAIIGNNLSWESLHINLKDLGLQDSIAANGTIVANALKVPSEIYEFLVNGSNKTFENQAQARVAFVQQVVQPLADNIANSINSYIGYEETPLVGSFAHLPEMQIIEDMKSDKVLKLSQAIRNLVQAGFTLEQANDYLETNGIDAIQ